MHSLVAIKLRAIVTLPLSSTVILGCSVLYQLVYYCYLFDCSIRIYQSSYGDKLCI